MNPELSKEQALEALQVYERKLSKIPEAQARVLIESMTAIVRNRFDPEFTGQTIRQLSPEQMSDLPSPTKDVA